MRLGSATALAVAATLVLTAGCAGPDESAASGGDASGPDAVRARAVASYERWAGDLAARQAAEYVVAHDLNATWADCMTERGYPRQWQHAIAAPTVPTDPLAATVWLVAPRTTMFSAAARREAWPLRQEALQAAPLADAEQRAAIACRSGADPTGADDSPRRPPELASLETAWQAQLAPIGQRYGGVSAWLDCLAEQQVPALTDWDPAGMAPAFEALRPAPEDIPLGSEPVTAPWQVFLGQERAFADADWECRERHYADAMPDLPAAVAAFETAHAGAIDTVAAYWAEVEREARELGWAPDAPYGELTP